MFNGGVKNIVGRMAACPYREGKRGLFDQHAKACSGVKSLRTGIAYEFGFARVVDQIINDDVGREHYIFR